MFGILNRTILIFSAISSMFYFSPNKVYHSPNSGKSSLEVKELYDYIVVGGGTAGCIVANRLSEDPLAMVLLIEAGGNEPLEAQIPAMAPYLQLTELDWQYQSSPSSTSCFGMVDNRCNLPRGKVLGGSSSINFMLYVRGNKRDFDSWWQNGNYGWKFSDVIEYFKKSEDNRDQKYSKNSDYHSTGGYQKVKEPAWKTPLSEAFLHAGRELGYPTIDVNAEKQSGFMFPQGFYNDGTRYSASRSFIDPIIDRKNLHIKLHSHVTKIIFNDKTAVGVTYQHKMVNHTVKCRREVILSAGAIGSPHLLMLSGIGPIEHLRSLDILPVANLSVGENLQDHVAGALPFVIKKPVSLKCVRYKSFPAIYQYIAWKSGPLSSLGAVEGVGFADTKYSNKSLQWPDIQFHFISGSYASDNGQYLRHTINIRQEIWDNYLRPLANLDTFTILVKLMRPRSTGKVQLASIDPMITPKIITNYLSDLYDVLVLLDGLEIAKKIGSTKAFQKFGSRLYDRPIPGCQSLNHNSREYWECFLRSFTLTIYHYSGTAKMGPYWDATAVVDPELRVYNVDGLRVIDASIFPTIPTGNINAAVMMVAEKGSDMIKNFWKQRLQQHTDANPRIIVENPSNILQKRKSIRDHLIEKREARFNINGKLNSLIDGSKLELNPGGERNEKKSVFFQKLWSPNFNNRRPNLFKRLFNKALEVVKSERGVNITNFDLQKNDKRVSNATDEMAASRNPFKYIFQNIFPSKRLNNDTNINNFKNSTEQIRNDTLKDTKNENQNKLTSIMNVNHTNSVRNDTENEKEVTSSSDLSKKYPNFQNGDLQTNNTVNEFEELPSETYIEAVVNPNNDHDDL